MEDTLIERYKGKRIIIFTKTNMKFGCKITDQTPDFIEFYDYLKNEYNILLKKEISRIVLEEKRWKRPLTI